MFILFLKYVLKYNMQILYESFYKSHAIYSYCF